MTITELATHRVENQTRQSVWDMKRTYNIDGHKVRVHLHHDPYSFQRDYRAEVFSTSTLSWNRVHTETTDWGDDFDILFLERARPAQLEAIEILFTHMTQVVSELLEGVTA